MTYGAKRAPAAATSRSPTATPRSTYYQQLANHDRVVDGYIEGSELRQLAITGTDERDEAVHAGLHRPLRRPTTTSPTSRAMRWPTSSTTSARCPWSPWTSVTTDAEVSDNSSTWEGLLHPAEARRHVGHDHEEVAGHRQGGRQARRPRGAGQRNRHQDGPGDLPGAEEDRTDPRRAAVHRRQLDLLRHWLQLGRAGEEVAREAGSVYDAVVAEFASPGSVSQWPYDDYYFKGAAKRPCHLRPGPASSARPARSSPGPTGSG